MNERSAVMARVRWRASWWSPSTSWRVRYFFRVVDARRFAERQRALGYRTRVDVADRPVRFGPQAEGE
ncbi:MAG: hypothetical protein ACT4QG_09315 [Sporichthyaceae bacterium]